MSSDLTGAGSRARAADGVSVGPGPPRGAGGPESPSHMVALDGTGAAPHRAQGAQGESTSDPEKNELTAQLGAAASAHVHQTDVAQEKTAAADAAAAENQKRMLTRAQKVLAEKQSALRRADNLEPETAAASRSMLDPRDSHVMWRTPSTSRTF